MHAHTPDMTLRRHTTEPGLGPELDFNARRGMADGRWRAAAQSSNGGCTLQCMLLFSGARARMPTACGTQRMPGHAFMRYGACRMTAFPIYTGLLVATREQN